MAAWVKHKYRINIYDAKGLWLPKIWLKQVRSYICRGFVINNYFAETLVAGNLLLRKKHTTMTGTFEELIASETPILIDFFAEWCGPCKVLSPTLQQLAEETGDKLKIVKIDVDRNPKLASKYKVSGVPTLMLFQNSELKWRQSGVLSLPQLKNVVQKFT
ncbi:thioredoxin [Emticicia sp. 17c]|uniref:thioredoxin n=1 Tax=Emticicia sp. 17c TaxID=3127704 RepID=UPI00301CC0B9